MDLFEDFNPDNISNKQLDQLRNDVYGGFKTRSIPRYEMRGAGSGRASRQTGYQDVFNPSYYKYHAGWSSIGDKLGININSQNDVRQMYDFVNGYKPPAAAAATPAPAPPPANSPLNSSSVYQQPDQVANYDPAKDPRAIKYQQDIDALKASNAKKNKSYNKQIDSLKSTINSTNTNFKSLQQMYAKQQSTYKDSINSVNSTWDTKFQAQNKTFGDMLSAQNTKYDNAAAGWQTQFDKQESSWNTKYGDLTTDFNNSVDKYDSMIDDLKIQNSTNLSNLNASFRASMKPVSQSAVGIKTKKSKANATGASSTGTRQLNRNPLTISNINL